MGQWWRLVVLALGTALALAGGAQAKELDPTKVKGGAACAECHKDEAEAWKKTTHYATFNTLHRRPKAQEIADTLGFASVKREGPCIGCHYSPAPSAQGQQVISGISCESCHGEARDWIDVHSDYGGEKVTKEQEPTAHRAQRMSRSVGAGMVRGSDLLGLAQRCYQCHTVPNERLVNVGGHAAGSAFELVSWSEGEVRHRFLASHENAPFSPAHRRVLYVLGQGLALEANLRGVAEATEKARYATAMARRVADTRKTLERIQQAMPITEVQEMLTAARSAALKLGNRAPLLAAADKVHEASRRFLAAHDGTDLGSLDPLLEELPAPKGEALE
jgi:hypothetical protein